MRCGNRLHLLPVCIGKEEIRQWNGSDRCHQKEKQTSIAIIPQIGSASKDIQKL